MSSITPPADSRPLKVLMLEHPAGSSSSDIAREVSSRNKSAAKTNTPTVELTHLVWNDRETQLLRPGTAQPVDLAVFLAETRPDVVWVEQPGLYVRRNNLESDPMLNAIRAALKVEPKPRVLLNEVMPHQAMAHKANEILKRNLDCLEAADMFERIQTFTPSVNPRVSGSFEYMRMYRPSDIHKMLVTPGSAIGGGAIPR